MIDLTRLNKNVVDIKPSGIRKFFDLASSAADIISLGVGEPDFETPWHIREEAIFTIEKGRTYYTPNLGLVELRKEICHYMLRRFDLHYLFNENVLVTVGGSEGIDVVMRTLISPGDEVILLTPGYVAYEPSVTLNGGIAVCVELKEENQFKLTKEALQAAITPKTKALLINFPGNPTGGIMSKEDYEPLIPLIKEHDLFVVSDEIYAELTYGSKHCSIGVFDDIKEQVIIVNGFSKAYSMTGWRLGYILANKELTSLFNKVHQYIIMCAPTISQYAGIEALKHGDDDVAYMKEAFEQRRNYLVNRLNEIGLKCHFPQGAFYVFPSIKCTGLTSEVFCERLIYEQKVACVPGTAFGDAGEGYIRISYASSLDQIKLAVERIEAFLKPLIR